MSNRNPYHKTFHGKLPDDGISTLYIHDEDHAFLKAEAKLHGIPMRELLKRMISLWKEAQQAGG